MSTRRGATSSSSLGSAYLAAASDADDVMAGCNFQEPVAQSARLLARRVVPAQAIERGVDSLVVARYGSGMEAFWQFIGILVKPDNIPIVFMMVLVMFFT